jgi:Domain of unknown function (DUF1906)
MHEWSYPRRFTVVILLQLLIALSRMDSQTFRDVRAQSRPGYLGFDRNDYPGDANLDSLRKAFSFAGYWLNAPPGTVSSSWLGKRALLRAKGFGFLLLFNGKNYSELNASGDPQRLGKRDGELATQLARREGFNLGAILFLDQEEGGRLLPQQRAYLHAWIDAVHAGGYRAGVYCSGIAGREAGGADVITARDIRENAGNRQITYFVANDQCPPSPGCVAVGPAPSPSASGVKFAEIWQFAQSPRRKQYTTSCAQSYAKDDKCYVSGKVFVDLDAAASPDPSRGR